MSIQLYVASQTISAPPSLEEDDMLDFEDIGGVYNDNSAGARNANTTALQTFLDNEGGSQGIALMFSGNRKPAYNNKRTPDPAYFDLSNGPITNKATDTEHADVALYGLAGSRVIGMGSQFATTPLFELTRRQGTFQELSMDSLIVENTTGSGIKLVGTTTNQGPGQRVMLSRVYFKQIATALGVQAIDYDGWTDVDAVPYAIYIDDADGCMLSNITIDQVNGHGIISTRWHEGLCHAGVRECQGSGLKLSEVNGTSLQVRAESNKGWGVHVRDTGNQRYTSTGTMVNEGAPNAWEVWLESNNPRESSSRPFMTSTGHTWRQMKVDSSSRLTVGGHSGWSSNKIQVQESVRRSCRFIQSDFIDPSVDSTSAFLVYDMNSDGVSAIGGANDNWSTQWPDVGDRPSVATVGDTASNDLEVIITVPAGAYDSVATASAAAWWNMQSSTFSTTDGDMLMYSIELSGDSDAVAYCEDREALVGADRMPAWLGSFTIQGPNNPTTTYALWNTAKRKLSNRVYLEDSVNSRMQCSIYFDGMGDIGNTGTTYPEFGLSVRIHSLKVYRVVA